ncbi:MAG: AAA family ATPase, partial [Cyanobacteria bacterium P01_A01_bin.83]
MLRDLTVQNYRCFEDFHIDGLERVNLFVGNNNSGKTSLLEAVYLLVTSNKEQALSETILNRINFFNTNHKEYYTINNLFFGYETEIPFPGLVICHKNNGVGINIDRNQKSLVYFDLKAPDYPETKFLWKKVAKFNIGYGKDLDYDAIPSIPYYTRGYTHPQVDLIIKELSLSKEKGLEVADSIITSAMTYAKSNLSQNNFIIIEKNNLVLDAIPDINNSSNNYFLFANKLDFNKLAFLWDSISLTTKEDLVIKSLQIIEKNTLKIDFSSSRNSNTIRIKLKNHSNPIPLSNMGEGMYRILALAMSLVTAENGVLLVDEIETGLHYEA